MRHWVVTTSAFVFSRFVTFFFANPECMKRKRMLTGSLITATCELVDMGQCLGAEPKQSAESVYGVPSHATAEDAQREELVSSVTIPAIIRNPVLDAHEQVVDVPTAADRVRAELEAARKSFRGKKPTVRSVPPLRIVRLLNPRFRLSPDRRTHRVFAHVVHASVPPTGHVFSARGKHVVTPAELRLKASSARS
jgi:hypothetical protein